MPADVRRKLGIGPGSILEWEEKGKLIFVRRAGRFTSEDIHRSLFEKMRPRARTIEEMKEGIRRYAGRRYARD